MPPEISCRPTSVADERWIASFTADHWGAEFVVAHGTIYRPASLPGFAARRGGVVVGLATYNIERAACELVTINATSPGRGIGSRLLDAVIGVARQRSCRRVWLVTTNDNLDALAFYRKRGFHLVAVHRDAVAVSRRLKPSIPLVAANGIAIRDELELELRLGAPRPG